MFPLSKDGIIYTATVMTSAKNGQYQETKKTSLQNKCVNNINSEALAYITSNILSHTSKNMHESLMQQIIMGLAVSIVFSHLSVELLYKHSSRYRSRREETPSFSQWNAFHIRLNPFSSHLNATKAIFGFLYTQTKQDNNFRDKCYFSECLIREEKLYSVCMLQGREFTFKSL